MCVQVCTYMCVCMCGSQRQMLGVFLSYSPSFLKKNLNVNFVCMGVLLHVCLMSLELTKTRRVTSGCEPSCEC